MPPLSSTPTLTIVPSEQGYVEKDGDKPGSQLPRLLKGFQKAVMLFFLCSAQFFDIFNAVSTIIALPKVCPRKSSIRGAAELTCADFQRFRICSRSASMGSNGIHSHLRDLPPACRSIFGHLLSQAGVFSRLCRCWRLQYSMWSQCASHHASRFSWHAGDRYVVPEV